MPKLSGARRIAAALAGCLLFAVLAFTVTLAAPSPPAPAVANPLMPGDVDLQQSRVYVFVGKTGLGHEHAVAGLLKSGVLHLGAVQDAGALEFDLTSFRADGDAARQYLGLNGAIDADTRQQVDANMLGPAVLNTARFGTAMLKIARAIPMKQSSRRGLPQYQLTGELQLHGVTRPITLVADAESQNGQVRLRGSCAFKQTAFGIRPFSKAFGAVGVADQLTVWGDIWIAQPGADAGGTSPPQ